MMKDLRGKVAVITGAASGMGRGLAVRLGREGCMVALVDVNPVGLEETADLVKRQGGPVTTHILDVTNREAVFAFSGKVVDAHKQVDILINNAGVIMVSPLKELSVEDFEWILNINLWGVIYCSMAFLPHLKQRPEANIVNISSTYGLIGIPLHIPYCTSKFAVRGFSESLKLELYDTPVSVSCVYPNLIKTNIGPGGRYKGMDKYLDVHELLARFYRLFDTMDADECAKVIIEKAVRQNKPRVLVGKRLGAIELLGRVLAGSYHGLVIRQMAYKLFGKETFRRMTN
jgi:NAD(P)-dependent dehydrogenase (short-subunit alcohol dehydrogenase family)